MNFTWMDHPPKLQKWVDEWAALVFGDKPANYIGIPPFWESTVVAWDPAVHGSENLYDQCKFQPSQDKHWQKYMGSCARIDKDCYFIYDEGGFEVALNDYATTIFGNRAKEVIARKLFANMYATLPAVYQFFTVCLPSGEHRIAVKGRTMVLSPDTDLTPDSENTINLTMLFSPKEQANG